MRKITSILMILMMLFSFTISVNAETVVTFTDSEQAKTVVNYQPENRKIVVDGTGYKNGTRISVFLYKPLDGMADRGDVDRTNINSVIYDLVQVVVEDNRYHYEISLPILAGGNVSGEKYNLEISSGDAALNSFKTVVYNATTEEIQEALRQFSQAGSGDLESLFNIYSQHSDTVTKPIISADIKNQAYVENKVNIHSFFVRERDLNFAGNFESLAQIETTFESAMAIAAINAADDADRASVLSQFNDLLELELDNDFYENNSQKVCTLMYNQTEASNGMLSSISDIKKAFKKAVIIVEMNESSRERIGVLLETYTEYFPNVNYQNANKDAVLKILWQKEFKTPEEVMTAFQSAVTEVLNTGGNGSFGGGGSLGGGGSSKIPDIGVSVVPSEKNDNSVFKDLSGYDWAKEAITTLYDANVIAGYGDGTFRPASVVKREEFVKMVVLAFDLSSVADKNVFADVPEESWFAPYVYAAYGNNIVNGQSNTIFGVGQGLTREDAACILYRILSRNGQLTVENAYNDFKDQDKISSYAEEAVKELSRLNIISGKDGGYFAPQDYITRAETAKMIHLVTLVLKN